MPRYGSRIGNVLAPRWPYDRPDQMPNAVYRGHALGASNGYASLDTAIAAARTLTAGADVTAAAVLQVCDRFRIVEAVQDPFFGSNPGGNSHRVWPLDVESLRPSQLDLAWIDTDVAVRAVVDGDVTITAVNP